MLSITIATAAALFFLVGVALGYKEGRSRSTSRGSGPRQRQFDRRKPIYHDYPGVTVVCYGEKTCKACSPSTPGKVPGR